MRWIAPTEKDVAAATLEKRLWAAADELRANSGLKSAEYSQPILGLIFLKFADARFAVRRAELAKVTTGRRGSRVDDPASYHAEGVLFLASEARFSELLEFPEGGRDGKTLGQAVDDAMRAVERDNEQLAGVLPKTYQQFKARPLKELLKAFSAIPVDLEGDSFGKIYEYFLGEFAMAEGQGGGEFYTPQPIVRLMVEILEPFKGRVLDPACGSGGMFVQSARFVSEHKKNGGLAIHGVEKVDTTGQLCRMNLAVHGLEGDIRHGGEINSYYDDPHNAVGRFDFVLANPPFNVDKVDKDRIRDAVGPGRRFPFGVPNVDNANYLWIQLFYSALNESGRAGFVMASSAPDARASEQELRRKLIESRAVDVIISVGSKMFYTVALPCTLWFLDRGKPKDRRDKVLFIDAQHIYRQVDRAHRDWTEAQIGFLANVARLFRREEVDLTFGGAEAKYRLREVFGNKPTYADVAGFCKAATISEIEKQAWSLNPGRYVGAAQGEEVSDEDFRTQFEGLAEEFETLTAEAREFEKVITKTAAEILG
ncbi:type I restriction-modification system subunit M [Anaeromyxobacter dehalogenans]|uniref:site-specific DNA-methyltransferase (adenine-specific) n=1 Tax=Anaeromyxobacter dehalogenans (strain 2CP-C) TaxID=290397 RepID=Q2IKB5_ANADE|nr:class I SAM-dependent DNA methyltransferase [Anaeromyxobacter dehalogenans]ABC82099.1 N-6 DNA methylase [Anaeromyxobacter dehalogenans 2CP-C]